MLRKFSNKQVFRAALLAGSTSMLALANPALAQRTPAPESPDEEVEQVRIVVTGSRIAQQDYDSNSPMVTIDEGFLENFGTAAIEVNLNRLPQFVPAQTPFAGGDIQPTATNTPGAATISLRGIGSNRNLVLIDGRRGTPANASGVIDINTIPFNAIERIETISGGASATYGADAIAGVTNFILKKNFVGLELDAQTALTQQGDGFEYNISGMMGADLPDGRGNVSIAMMVNTREANFQRDRSWNREQWARTSVGGNQFFLDTPGVNFLTANIPNFNTVFNQGGPVNRRPGTSVFFQPDGRAFTSGFGTPGLNNFTLPLDAMPYKRTDAGTIVQNNLDLYLVLPLTRYNAFARGNFEINDWIGVFATAQFSHVETSTLNEPGPITGGWSVVVDRVNADGTPRIPDSSLPADLVTLLNSRGNPNAPFQLVNLMPQMRETHSDVTTYNLVAGFEGSIPGSSFTWEAFVNHGVSMTFANQTGIYSLTRLREVLNAGDFGRGFNRQGNAQFGGFGASRGRCTSGMNFFMPPAGGFSPDCLEAVNADLKNRSKMEQTMAVANLTGNLFKLPAGDVGVAIGGNYWETNFEFLNDTLTTQGRSFMDQALGIYPSGNSRGNITVWEMYGETLVPLLSDLPGIEQLNLELGGRISDFNTTGVSYTYKILGDWQVTDWMRFRGGYNRAERAPNIAELFLAPQQTFGFNNVGDLCSKGNPLQWSANNINANGPAVEAVCRAKMARTDPDAAAFFYQQEVNPATGQLVFVNGAGATGTGGFAFPTTVGNPNVRPEQADTWTAGVVITSPIDTPLLERFRLSVDWFEIFVNNAIGQQSVGVALRQCLDPAFNPLVLTDPVAAANTQFCQNIVRQPQLGTLGDVNVTFANNGRFRVEGIDAALDWGFDLGPGAVNLNALVNYQIAFESAELPTEALIDFAGTGGTTVNGLNAGAYRFRSLTTLGYRLDGFFLSLQWQHLPAINNAALAQFNNPDITGLPAYNIFFLNGNVAVTDDVNLRFGVDNLFNTPPPFGNVNTVNTTPLVNGQLPGGGLGGAFYDLNGRRFWMGANMRF